MVFSMEVTDAETLKKEIIEQVKPVPEEVTYFGRMKTNIILYVPDCGCRNR